MRLWLAALVLLACPRRAPPPDPSCAPTQCFAEANAREADEDLPAAIVLHRRACASGIAASCLRLAALSATEAQGALQRACELNEADACMRAADISSDPERLTLLLAHACSGRNWLGCARLANLMRLGRGIKADPAKAVQLYADACYGGHQESCLEAARMYADGAEVPRDTGRAAALYMQSCTSGGLAACADAARNFVAGSQLGRSVDTAANIYALACEKKEPLACFQLAELLELGSDLARAMSLTRRLCESGVRFMCPPTQPNAADALEVNGPLSLERVTEVVARRRRGVEFCFRNAGEVAASTWVVHFRIEPTGEVRSVELVEPKGAEADVADCVTGQIRLWKFATSDAPSTVVWKR